MVENTEWTVAQVYNDLKWACPVKVIYENEVLFNDYDDCTSSEEVLKQHKALLKNNNKVGEVLIYNVDFHHAIVYMNK